MRATSFISYSVIIPHYNDAERLERLLRSFPAARNDIQVIVVDDCSPDSYGLALVRQRWPMVQWHSTAAHSGAGVARNVGLVAAKGDYLIFADSDDEFLPGAFNVFDHSIRSDDQLVFFLAEGVQESSGRTSIRSSTANQRVIDFFISPDDSTCLRLCLGHVAPWAKVYSRYFIESKNLRFDPVHYANDMAFNILASLEASRLRAELIPVYRIYRRGGSLTSNMSKQAFMTRFLVRYSLALRLEAAGRPGLIEADGLLLRSVTHGPGTALKVFMLSIKSPLVIRWSRIFQWRAWQKCLIHEYRSRLERWRNR